MQSLTKILALSAGGVVGVNARYWLGVWIHRYVSAEFPWATFVINVTGSFAIGFLGIALTAWSPHSHLRLLAITGLLGGYTTFSTFTYDSITMWQRGEWKLAFLNLFMSVLLGCTAVMLGAAAASATIRPGRVTTAAARDRSLGPLIRSEKDGGGANRELKPSLKAPTIPTDSIQDDSR